MLRELGLHFEQAEPPFDDPPQPEMLDHESPGALAAHLAEKKACSLAATISKNSTILAADTICVDFQNNLIGTPTTESEAREMIHTFSNCDHQVVTGVCLIQTNTGAPSTIVNQFADTATVTLGHLTDMQIQDYLHLNTWPGKAGGYNLTERLEVGWPITVEGDSTTVVGLPMIKLKTVLTKLGFLPT